MISLQTERRTKNKKLFKRFWCWLFSFTIAIYAIVCHFIDKKRNSFVYAVLIGCIAYLPVFLQKKKTPLSFFQVPDALIREQSPPTASITKRVPAISG